MRISDWSSDVCSSDLGGLVALSGTLAPKGAILKRAAATPGLFEREGRAVVFPSLEDLSRRIDDPDLDVPPEDFMVLHTAGPLAAGMPESGYLPIPANLPRAGVKDLMRNSAAPMNGTAFVPILLNVPPAAALRGTPA